MSVVYVESCLNIEQIKNNKKLILIKEYDFSFADYHYEDLNKKYLKDSNMYRYNGKLKDTVDLTLLYKSFVTSINKDKLNDELNIYIYVKDEFKTGEEEEKKYKMYISKSLYSKQGEKYRFCYNYNDEDETIIKIEQSIYDFSNLKTNSNNGNYNIKLKALNNHYIDECYNYIKRHYGGEYKITDVLFLNERHGGMYTGTGSVLNYCYTKIILDGKESDFSTFLKCIENDNDNDNESFYVKLDIEIRKCDNKKLYFIADCIDITSVNNYEIY